MVLLLTRALLLIMVIIIAVVVGSVDACLSKNVNTYMHAHTHTHTHIPTCTPGLHKLPNGVKTVFFEALEKGKNYVMPTNADEFQEMMELVLYNPKSYTFHQRMREALVQIQKPNYAFFHESECLFLCNATIYSLCCFALD